MQVFLNRIDGLDDAICSMYLSKRNLTRELEQEIRGEVQQFTAWGKHLYAQGELSCPSDALKERLEKLFKWGRRHMTLLRFVDFSFTVYGLHRGAQDDFDSHAMRLNNRIIRSSTRLGSFSQGEMSEYYQSLVIPTDVALAHLGISIPDTIKVGDQEYSRAPNGYVLQGCENKNDVRRGLYMLSIPSNFIFRVQLTEFAHIYKERGMHGNAHPELKQAVESMAYQIEKATAGYVTQELLMAIPN